MDRNIIFFGEKFTKENNSYILGGEDMIASIVGNYLKEKGLLSSEQLMDLLEEHRKVRAKLGIIAVAEGLISPEEAERINRLQAIMDMRFGDIAIEEGYLTEAQVENLLKKQENAYLAFAQALENQRLMLIEQLEQLLIDFQYDNGFTSSDMEILKCDDVDQILTLFIPKEAMEYEPIASVAVRTLMRLVDLNICIGRGFLTNYHEIENGAVQKVAGKTGFTTALVGKGTALCEAAGVYGEEVFNVVDEDAIDAIGEIVNCINGLSTSSLGQHDASLDLCPPEYYLNVTSVEAKEMLVVPMKLLSKDVELVITLGDELKIK